MNVNNTFTNYSLFHPSYEGASEKAYQQWEWPVNGPHLGLKKKKRVSFKLGFQDDNSLLIHILEIYFGMISKYLLVWFYYYYYFFLSSLILYLFFFIKKIIDALVIVDCFGHLLGIILKKRLVNMRIFMSNFRTYGGCWKTCVA